MKEIEKNLNGAGMRIGIVQSRFNRVVCEGGNAQANRPARPSPLLTFSARLGFRAGGLRRTARPPPWASPRRKRSC